MRKCYLTIIALMTGVSAIQAQSDSLEKKQDEWKMVWNDEFNGKGEPDANKWTAMEQNRRNNDKGPDGWWLKEDVYQNGEGQLVIKAKTIKNRNNDGDSLDYSSGAIESKGLFQQKFGKFEVRCQLPEKEGWWAAFWMFGDDVMNVNGNGEDGTELDIMEGFGWIDRVQHALHWDGYEKDHKFVEKKVFQEGIRKGYHTYALEWTDTEYIFFIDGKETWRTKEGGVSKSPAWIVLTGEVSTEEWATANYWAKSPNPANFPDYYLVDYVRVYKRESTLAKLNTSNGSDKAVSVILEDFNTGKNLDKNWWIGSPATYISAIEDGKLKMKCTDVKEYQAFGKTFWEGEPLDINKTKYLKLRVKMQGDEKVKLRVNIRDQFDATNNKNSPFKYLYESKEFQDVYIDISSSSQQEWPSAVDLKMDKIREIIFFANPEGPAFTGTIYIDDITLVNQLPQN